MSSRYGRNYGRGYESDRSAMDRDYEYEGSQGGMSLRERGANVGGRDRDYERYGRERGYGSTLGGRREFGMGREYEDYGYGREGGDGSVAGRHGPRDYPNGRRFEKFRDCP